MSRRALTTRALAARDEYRLEQAALRAAKAEPHSGPVGRVELLRCNTCGAPEVGKRAIAHLVTHGLTVEPSRIYRAATPLVERGRLEKATIEHDDGVETPLYRLKGGG